MAGANLRQVRPGYLSNVQAKARAYAQETGALLMPFGLDMPQAIKAIADAARFVQLEFTQFDEVWCAVGSGVLLRSLMRAGLGRSYYGVAVGKDTQVPGATIIEHALPFEANAKILPPFPSCSNYDAKVWEHVCKREGRVLFWNVMA